MFTLAATYGTYRLVKYLYRFSQFVWRHTLRQPHDLMARYGSKTKKSWVVVTGGSDGFGYEICKKLAAKGFNICIIARNEQKMKEKLATLPTNI